MSDREISELQVVAALMAEPSSLGRIEGMIDEEDFGHPGLAVAFRAVTAMIRKRRFSVDLLADQLVLEGMKAEDAPAMVAFLQEQGFTSDPVGFAEHVRACANKDRLHHVAKWAEGAVNDAMRSDTEFQAELEGRLLDAVRLGNAQRGPGNIGAGVERWLDEIANPETAPATTSTGVAALDAKLGGYRGGQMIVVGGRPSMGKSIFGLSAALTAAADGGGVFMVSMEMTREELRARALSDLARERRQVTYRKILSSGLNTADVAALRMAAEDLKTRALIVEDRGGRSAAQITLGARAARKQLEKQGRELRLVVVDYLQLMATDAAWKGNQNMGVAKNSAALKELAKELNVPVIVLSQLSRQVETRDNKRPTMADLRDSGSIEQDADVVLFPFRPEYYIEREMRAAKESQRADLEADLAAARNRMLIDVAKQRNGPIGDVKAFCDAGTSSIRDADVDLRASASLLDEVAA